MRALVCRAVGAALILVLAGTANAASISAENQVDGFGTTSWDIAYNPAGSATIGSIDVKVWANGAGVTGISGTDLIGNVPLGAATFTVFSAPSTASQCPGGVATAGCINYGGFNPGTDTVIDPTNPIVIGTVTVNYSSNAPPITLEIVPGSVLFGNIAGDISNTTEQVRGTVRPPRGRGRGRGAPTPKPRQ